MANAHRIAREMRIKLKGRSDQHPNTPTLPPRTTWSRDAIKRVAEFGVRNGVDDHIYNVLTLLVSRDNGACMLFGDVIHAVSKWAAINRVSSAEIPFLATPFEVVDLASIRSTVLHYRIENRSSQIALLFAAEMEPALDELRR